MKTTIIDLLNKIANGEEVPRKFTYNGYLWEYDVKNKMWFYYFGKNQCHRFDRFFYLNMTLNDEVEILDEPKEDKIGKLEFEFEVIDETEFVNKYPRISYIIETQKNKINELIDEVNKIKVNNEPR